MLLVIISAAGFGSGALFVQPLYDAEHGATPVMFWRFGTAALFGWGFLLLAQAAPSLRSLPRRRVAVLLLLGALFVGNSYAYLRLAAGRAHHADLDHHVPLSGHRGGAGDAPRASPGGTTGLARAGHLPRGRGARPGWYPERRVAAAVGPGAGLGQPGHLCHLDRAAGSPRRATDPRPDHRHPTWRAEMATLEPAHPSRAARPTPRAARVGAPDPSPASSHHDTATAMRLRRPAAAQRRIGLALRRAQRQSGFPCWASAWWPRPSPSSLLCRREA